MSNFDYNPLVMAVVDGEGDDALSFVEDALNQGIPAYEIIDMGLIKGMKIVSDKYDAKEFFVPDLAAAAEAMTQALERLKPLLQVQKEMSKGTIVIGVIKECSQEIGKNIVTAMLSGAGFSVHDLGINVSPRTFVDKAKEFGADIIAMGSPMLQTVKYFAETEQLLRQEGLREKVKVLVGGAATNRSTPEITGVDSWAENGREAITAAEGLMEQLKGRE